jgi:hypothetical protein
MSISDSLLCDAQASAEGELDSLLQQMGPRGRLLQSGVGMADIYSAMLQRIEKRLMADRRVVGIMVEAEEAERSKHEVRPLTTPSPHSN